MTIFSVVLGAISAALLFIATSRYGVNYTPDSIHYLATSESLAHGKGFVDMGGEPYTVWPPLFPLLLAGARALSVDVLTFVRYLNVVLIAALAPLATSLCFSASRRPLLSLLAGGIVGFAPVILLDFGHVWSEPLFVVLMLASAVLLVAYAGSTRPWLLVVSAVVAALCCLQRYIGVVFVGTAGLTLLLLESGRLVRRFGIAAAYCAGALLPIGAWMIRNRLVVGSLAGARAAPTATFSANVKAVFDAARSMLVVDPAPALGVLLLFLLLAGLALAGLVRYRGWRDERERSRSYALALSFLIVPIYCGMLIFIATVSGTEISARILSPLLPFIFTALVGGTSLLLPSMRPSWATATSVGVALLLVAYSAVLVNSTANQAGKWHYRGVFNGYNQRTWLSDPVYRWLLTHGKGMIVYSNVPAPALQLMSHGRIDARVPQSAANGVQRLTVEPDRQTVYAHFNRRGIVKLSRLRSFTPSVAPPPFASLPSGGIYRVGPGTGQ